MLEPIDQPGAPTWVRSDHDGVTYQREPIVDETVEPLSPYRETGEAWTLGEEPLVDAGHAQLYYSPLSGAHIYVNDDGSMLTLDDARELSTELAVLLAAADERAAVLAELDRTDMPEREAWHARVAELERARVAAREHAELARESERAEARERAERRVRQRETRAGTKVFPTRAAMNSGEPVLAFTVRTPREQRRHVLLVRLAAAGIAASHAAAFAAGWVM